LRQVVATLDQLLQLLYSEPQSLDIITYHDILRIYRLTGLGSLATAAIDKSQRIVRAQGNYRQRGLGEFHIGLIYLHWGDCRGAAQQFVIARHQWLFVNDIAAVALSYFAHGEAMFHAYHYEAALGSYNKVERWLVRSQVAPQVEHPNQHSFVLTLEKLLGEAEQSTRRILWPEKEEEQGSQPAGNSTHPISVSSAPTAETAAQPASVPLPSPDPPPVAPPHSNLPVSGEKELPTPTPGHRLVDERFYWCQIVGQRGEFVAGAQIGVWLLVDTRVARRRFEAGDMVIIGSDRDHLGQILVWPGEVEPRFVYYYLGRVLAATVLFAESDSLAIALDESGRPHTVVQGQIIGLFVGAWNTALP
jgi:hypothetical protein